MTLGYCEYNKNKLGAIQKSWEFFLCGELKIYYFHFLLRPSGHGRLYEMKVLISSHFLALTNSTICA